MPSEIDALWTAIERLEKRGTVAHVEALTLRVNELVREQHAIGKVVNQHADILTRVMHALEEELGRREKATAPVRRLDRLEQRVAELAGDLEDLATALNGYFSDVLRKKGYGKGRKK